jgi:hypothetical protein
MRRPYEWGHLNAGPPVGTIGTVVSSEAYGELLVVFQNWYDGHDGHGVVAVAPGTGRSHWYVREDHIERMVGTGADIMEI